ncbi:hypothetical protein CBZ97_007040 [Salmonella enterica]|nr:hypothetical protein [Salmonella enterica]
MITNQKQWLEVQFAGKSLGIFEVSVTPDSILFLHPGSVWSSMDISFSPDEPAEKSVRAALSKPMSRNGHLACGNNKYMNTAGCGYLSTENVGLIYDESEGVIHLFLAKHMQTDLARHQLYFPPGKDGKTALVHQQSLNVIADKNYRALSFQGTGALGLTDNGFAGVNWLVNASQSKYNKNQNITASNAYFRQGIGNRYYLQAGRMDTRDLSGKLGGNIAFNQLPIPALNGVRTGSTLSYLNQNEASGGSPVIVMLSQSSRIDAYRGGSDGQLLGSFYLPAGTQALDTSGFPPGSYTITLNVYENNVLQRTESQIFTKAGTARDGSVQWFLQAGKTSPGAAALKEAQSVTSMQGGVRIPLRAWEFTVGASALGDSIYGESGVQWMHSMDNGWLDGTINLQGSYLKGSDGAHGNMQQLGYNNGLSFSLYRYASGSDLCNRRYAQTELNQQRFTPGCSQSLSTMLSLPVEPWSLSVAFTRSSGRSSVPATSVEQARSPGSYFYRPGSNRSSNAWQFSAARTLQWRELNLALGLGVTHRSAAGGQRDDVGGFVTLSLTRERNHQIPSVREHTSLNTSYQYARNGASHISWNGTQSWQWGETLNRELGISVGGVNSETANAGVRGRTVGRYGTADGALSDSYQRRTGSHHTAFSGSYSSSLALSRDGIFWGAMGDGLPGAAVAVKTVGLDDDNRAGGKVVVSLDNGSQATLGSGERILLPLSGYSPSLFQVRDSTEITDGVTGNVVRGAGRQQLFLLPGKMETRQVVMQTLYTYLGRLLTAGGAPLSGAVGVSEPALYIQPDGGFSLETPRRLKQLYVLEQRQLYQCDLDVNEPRDGTSIWYAGTVYCHNITLTALPAEYREQAGIFLSGHKDNATALVAVEPQGGRP